VIFRQAPRRRDGGSTRCPRRFAIASVDGALDRSRVDASREDGGQGPAHDRIAIYPRERGRRSTRRRSRPPAKVCRGQNAGERVDDPLRGESASAQGRRLVPRGSRRRLVRAPEAEGRGRSPPAVEGAVRRGPNDRAPRLQGGTTVRRPLNLAGTPPVWPGLSGKRPGPALSRVRRDHANETKSLDRRAGCPGELAGQGQTGSLGGNPVSGQMSPDRSADPLPNAPSSVRTSTTKRRSSPGRRWRSSPGRKADVSNVALPAIWGGRRAGSRRAPSSPSAAVGIVSVPRGCVRRSP